MKKIVIICIYLFLTSIVLGQDKVNETLKKEIKYPELKKTFNEDGSHYIKATVVGQF